MIKNQVNQLESCVSGLAPAPAAEQCAAAPASLRTADQDEAFVAAIKEAIRRGHPSLSWDRVGLIYTAMLLQPVAAGAPSRQLVTDYEEIIRQRPEEINPQRLGAGWAGDVWAFAVWARDNLPGFDPHRPNLAFLPKPP